jgi:hypothetical protein
VATTARIDDRPHGPHADDHQALQRLGPCSMVCGEPKPGIHASVPQRFAQAGPAMGYNDGRTHGAVHDHAASHRPQLHKSWQ